MLERASGPSPVRATPNSSSTSPSAAAPLSSPIRMMVITDRHSDAVSDQLPDIFPRNLLAEPSLKESAAAIGLAAVVLALCDREAIIGSFGVGYMINGTMRS